MCARFIKLSGKIGIKYERKGNNSVILNDKNAKKLHKLHTGTKNLNTHLWILMYNGFAIIPDLRQTGIAENLATFGKKNSMNFSVCPVNLFAKRIRFLSPLVFL